MKTGLDRTTLDGCVGNWFGSVTVLDGGAGIDFGSVTVLETSVGNEFGSALKSCLKCDFGLF